MKLRVLNRVLCETVNGIPMRLAPGEVFEVEDQRGKVLLGLEPKIVEVVGKAASGKGGEQDSPTTDADQKPRGRKVGG